MTKRVLTAASLFVLVVLAARSVPASLVITGVTNAPGAPAAGNPVWVTAQVTGVPSVTNVVLTYG